MERDTPGFFGGRDTRTMLDACFSRDIPTRIVEAPGTSAPHPFDAAPPRGRRHLIVQMEDDDEDGYDFMFFGATWGFRGEFDAAGIEGGQVDTGGSKEYVRILKGIKNDEPGRAMVKRVMTNVLKNQRVFLVVEVEKTVDEMVIFVTKMENVSRR
jgi:hypothetical protein